MNMKKTALFFTALIVSVWTVALASPPDHAPAHGWRKKHDPHYVGYTGVKWERDYEVLSGRCNREAIGAVLGGVVGGVVGSQIGDGTGRTVATIVGAAAGALIGAKVGRNMDDKDRACVGHALEIGATGRTVSWQNSATGVRYQMVPSTGRKTSKGACRDFTLKATDGSQRWSRHGMACQSRQGVWEISRL
jgi:outer membrane lipoprotein SlyB